MTSLNYKDQFYIECSQKPTESNGEDPVDFHRIIEQAGLEGI